MQRVQKLSHLALLSLFFYIPALAGLNPYYNIPNPSMDLKQDLFTLLEFYHSPQSNQPDELLSSCKEETCYRHTSVGYEKARQYMFGFLFLKGQSPSTYSLLTSYCQIEITNKDLAPSDPLAPMNIPDYKVVNAEHTWPQSFFSKKFPKDLQKSDLHILLPELTEVNSQRNNHPFGEVKTFKNSLCSGTALGKDQNNKTVFEPHDAVKGNVARALFYFSVRYKMSIDPSQETVLRKWHEMDPVDSDEDLHNEQVFKIQKNRNPFIDNPDWVEQISDF
ncbi:endonuclease [bacterium]|nr:endonuclease [bacterium]